MKHLEPLDGRTYCYLGERDTHFGDNGLARISVPYAGESKDGALTPSFMAVDANGRAMIGSTTKNNFTLRRIDAFGVNDDAFAASAAGLPQAIGTQTNASRLDVELDATNRIYVLNGTTVTRYRSNGQVDRSFGNKGRVRLAMFKQAADLDVGADGHIWVVGTSGARGSVAGGMSIVRLTADGRGDKSFATNGEFIVPPPVTRAGDYNASAMGEVIHGFADGSVVFAGRGERLYRDAEAGYDTTQYYHSIQSVRLDNRGRLVKSYGYRGIVTADYIYNDAIVTSNPHAVGIRSDGTVFVGNAFSTDSPDPATAGGQDTRIIAPSGSTGILKNPGISTTLRGEFFDGSNGGSYFVNSQGLWQLNGDGTAYTPFNFGKPSGAITAAALANNGQLLTAETGRSVYDKYVNVSRYFVSRGAAATLVPATLTKSAKSLSFSVWYENNNSDYGLSPADFNGSELRISGPGYTGPAKLVSAKLVDEGDFSRRVVVEYTLTRPGGKRFTAAQNGLYAVSLTGGKPYDGNGTATIARRIGTLVINVA